MKKSIIQLAIPEKMFDRYFEALMQYNCLSDDRLELVADDLCTALENRLKVFAKET